MLEILTEQLNASQSLTGEQVRAAVSQLVAEQIPIQVKADFLIALAGKGETADEIAAFAKELRSRSVQPPIDEQTRAGEIIDVCGTGGDHLNTFNISTTVALVVASAGVPVAKHGNRAVTSGCGSADVLEALGIRIDLEPERAVESLRQHQFGFFFAPKYHPAFKHIAPARRLCAERGQRTIFNFLGPLLNPARPSAQLLGVPRPSLCEPMAQVLQALGVRRGMIVCGAAPSQGATHSELPDGQRQQYLDELSTLGNTVIAEFYHERGFSTSTYSPSDLPLQPATLQDLRGGDRQHNAEIIRRILAGTERGPKRDAVLLNAGAALLVAGVVQTISDGWSAASELIESGQAKAKLEQLVEASRDV